MKSLLLLQKNDPSLPNICHLGVLVTWQRSAPEPEKLGWVNNGHKSDKQSGLWETQDSCLVLPGSLADPIFWFLNSFTHCNAFKMPQIMNRHWWEDFYKIANPGYQPCLACQVHDPRRTIFIPKGPRPSPSGPSEHLQPDFIHLALSKGY